MLRFFRPVPKPSPTLLHLAPLAKGGKVYVPHGLDMAALTPEEARQLARWLKDAASEAAAYPILSELAPQPV